ncbi:MAG: hypothetical protein ACE5K7_02495 [Phycisphaerae bacterium]
MSNVPDDIDQRLLDYRLGRLEAGEAAELERLIAAVPEIADRSRRLGRLCDLLDSYDVPEPPAGLEQRVLNRVRAEEAGISLQPAGSALPTEAEGRLSGWPMVSVRELVGLAAAITIFVGVLMPGYWRGQYIARRNECAANLGQIGLALAAYANEHDGALPFAGYVREASWLRPPQPGVRFASNSRHIYLLAKRGYVGHLRIFVCPGRSDGIAMQTEDPEQFDDFAEPANISYSTHNPGRRSLRISIDGRMAVVGDRNPFVHDGRFEVREALDVNSDAHGRGLGQNVLYCDGSVGWRDSAAAGPGGDNIWLAGQQRRYRGTETPLYVTDAFLIP